MREIRTCGSEGGAAQSNASFLPLYLFVFGKPEINCHKVATPRSVNWMTLDKAALPALL